MSFTSSFPSAIATTGSTSSGWDQGLSLISSSTQSTIKYAATYNTSIHRCTFSFNTSTGVCTFGVNTSGTSGSPATFTINGNAANEGDTVVGNDVIEMHNGTTAYGQFTVQHAWLGSTGGISPLEDSDEDEDADNGSASIRKVHCNFW